MSNFAPLLTGGGKLIFPETSPSATISASSGTLTVAAGGTNQNVNLTPSGTGVVLQSASANSPVEYQAKNTDAVDTGSLAAFVATSDWGDIALVAHNSGRTVSRFGVTLGGWGEITTDGAGNGLAIGTRTATPLILGTNALNRMEIFSTGGASLGSTTDPGAGVFNAANGLSVAGTKVVGARQPTIPQPTGGSPIDTQARAAINSIIATLQAHGLIS
jgi:hypothetical protein